MREKMKKIIISSLAILSALIILSSRFLYVRLPYFQSIGYCLAGCVPLVYVLLYRKTMRLTWLFGPVAFLLFFIGLEAGLSVGQFKYQFLPKNTGSQFKEHPYLFWVPETGSSGEVPLAPPMKNQPVPFDKDSWSPSFSLGVSPKNSPVNFRSGPVVTGKPDGTIRIVTLGGSNAWGWGIKDYSDTFTGQLESKLKKAMPEKNIEWIAAGVQGYRLFHILVLYKLYIRNYKPDLVIVYANNNDMYAEYAPFTWRELFEKRSGVDVSDLWISQFEFPKQGSPLFRLQDELQRLKTYNLMTEWITDIRKGVLPGKEDSWLLGEVNPLEDYKQNLEDLISIVSKDGGQLILADSFAHFYIDQYKDAKKDDNRREWMKRYMKESARNSGAIFVPVHDILAKSENPDKFVFAPPHTGHINKVGHQTLADILYSLIVQKKLLE